MSLREGQIDGRLEVALLIRIGIIELEGMTIDLDGIALLDAHLLQLPDDALIHQELLEELEALLCLQVRIAEHLLDLRTLDGVGIRIQLLELDGELLLMTERLEIDLALIDLRLLRTRCLDIGPGGLEQIAKTSIRRCRNCKDLHALWLVDLLDARECTVRPLLIDDEIRLIACDDHRLLENPRIILRDLIIDRPNILDRISALRAGSIDHVDQHLTTLDMTQELVTEADPLRGTLDETRNVRHDEAAVALQADHTEMRRQRREVIVRDLRTRITAHRKNRRLTHVRKTDETDIRDHTKLHLYPELTGILTRLRELRCLHGRCREMHITETALTALQQNHTLVLAGHIRDDLLRLEITNDRSLRNTDHQILTILTMHTLSAAFFTRRRDILLTITEILERIQTLIHLDDDITALTAITTIRTTRRHVQLTTERHMTISALTTLDENLCNICKHRIFLLSRLYPSASYRSRR